MSDDAAKVGQLSNHYTPTYARAPRIELGYNEVMDCAEQRYLFHERLAYESKQQCLDYRELRTLGVTFGIPIKKLSSNANQLDHDLLSFYCLLMVSLHNEESKQRFARNEERLFVYRLRASGISIVQIKDYFWTDKPLRDELIANYQRQGDGGFFRLPFETAFGFFDSPRIDIIDGFARLSLDEIYQIVGQMYKSKLLRHIDKQSNSLGKNVALV
jgi:hypothetical protein